MMNNASRIRLITFDAYNTLFKPKGSLSAQYVSVLTLHGDKPWLDHLTKERFIFYGRLKCVGSWGIQGWPTSGSRINYEALWFGVQETTTTIPILWCGPRHDFWRMVERGISRSEPSRIDRPLTQTSLFPHPHTLSLSLVSWSMTPFWKLVCQSTVRKEMITCWGHWLICYEKRPG
jgi:hypothetical protein